jgi:hypothetical protein
VVGVAWTGSEGDFEDFVGRHGLTFPSLSDAPGAIFDRFEIPYQPAFAIVRPDGQVETLLGSAGDDIIDMIVRDAIG